MILVHILVYCWYLFILVDCSRTYALKSVLLFLQHTHTEPYHVKLQRMPGCLWAKKPEIRCNHATLCRADCLAFACEVCRCYYNHGLFDYAILWRGQKAPWDVDLDVYRCSETGLHWHGVAGEQTSESECRSYRRGVWQFKFKLMHCIQILVAKIGHSASFSQIWMCRCDVLSLNLTLRRQSARTL